MKTSGNTLLITGGGSGIGRALAESFHRLGNKVIIAGRRQAALEEVARGNPGMVSATLDIEDAAAIRTFASRILAEHPTLDGVIHNAGIMRQEDLQQLGGDVSACEATITTNLLGPIRLNAALLPHLLQQPDATIMTVSSGLAFIPRSDTPTYCATKAAIHSYTQSLRFQLRHTRVQVIELIPPYVQTELMGEKQASDPNALPLKDFISEVMQIIRTAPSVTEILVERVKPLRYAERSEDYETLFKQRNERYATRR